MSDLLADLETREAALRAKASGGPRFSEFGFWGFGLIYGVQGCLQDVCKHTRVCICIYIYIYIHIYIHTYIYICVDMFLVVYFDMYLQREE